MIETRGPSPSEGSDQTRLRIPSPNSDHSLHHVVAPNGAAREQLFEPRNEEDSSTRAGEGESGAESIIPTRTPEVELPSGPSLQRPSQRDQLAPNTQPESFLERRGQQAKQSFQAIEQEVSFDRYLDMVRENPRQHLRNAAGLHVDALEYWDQGQAKMVTRLGRTFRAFRAAEKPWESDAIQKKGHLYGQDYALYQTYQVLRMMSREAFPDYGILFHGAPGTGKTILSEDILMGAVAAYTQRAPEGAIYGTCFELPPDLVRNVDQGSLGFSRAVLEKGPDGSLRIFTKSNPIFLLSDLPRSDKKSDRESFLFDELGYQPANPGTDSASASSVEGRGRYQYGQKAVDFNVDYLLKGRPDPTSQVLYKLLERHYQGDLAKVFSHVKAVRWSMNRDTSNGLVNVSPVPTPNAEVSNIRAPIRYLPDIFGVGDENVPHISGIGTSAHRGRLNLQEACKGQTATALSYLLGPLEGRPYQVRSGGTLVQVQPDQVITLEENDQVAARALNPNAEGTDALESRLKKVRVPLLRVASDEQGVYEQQLGGAPVAPYATKIAALWSVGTRTLKPNPRNYADPEEFNEDERELVASLEIVEKLLLLDDVPDRELNVLRDSQERFNSEEIQTLRELAPEIADEYLHGEIEFAGYDGAQGIDTRKAIRAMLRPLLEQADGEPLNVLNVVNFLETSGIAAHYERLINQAKGRLVQLHWNNDHPNEEFRLARPAEKQPYEERVEENYLFLSGDELNEAVREIAEFLVRRDFEKALGMADVEQAIQHVKRYAYHCRAFCNKDMKDVSVEIPLEFRDGLEDKASETVMRAFEDKYTRIGTQDTSNELRTKYRERITRRLGEWSVQKQMSALDHIDQAFSSLVTEVFDDLSSRHAHYVTDYQECLQAGVQPLDTSEKAQRFRDANEALIKMGYPQDQIGAHFVFAFNHELRQGRIH